jgi:surfeit locus 1 family protein
MKKGAFASLALVGVALLTSLGVWQLQRRAWKHELVARIERFEHARPRPAPGPRELDPAADEYRPVTVSGRFLNDRETLVQAVTRLGGGYWVMTPLRTDGGTIVVVNRGFVTADQRRSRDWWRVEGEATVVGRIRLTEPGGGFLRDNRPLEDRWYSRDVAAIARARGLTEVAPYFIDEYARAEAAALGPVGGLTVLRFNDNHLQYALTWFALALMLALLLARGAYRILRR